MKRWVLAVACLIIAIILAAIMLHSTQVIDLKPILVQRIEAMPALAPHLETYRAGQVAETIIEETKAEVEVEKGELIQKQLELDTRAAALATKEKQLARTQSELKQEREELLGLKEEIEAVRAGLLELERLRSIYAEMKGKDAAAIMSQLRPEMIAFLLAEMDPEVAGNILTNLDPKLAAEITRMALTSKK
ncbi:MAG: hypothetical protein GX977_13180 [Firmicutes bacterium]|jgi:flagellar motility protein MotE (MotC chaperone)|nr:hypothetical protein [Bacillota bacterium]